MYAHTHKHAHTHRCAHTYALRAEAIMAHHDKMTKGIEDSSGHSFQNIIEYLSYFSVGVIKTP